MYTQKSEKFLYAIADTREYRCASVSTSGKIEFSAVSGFEEKEENQSEEKWKKEPLIEDFLVSEYCFLICKDKGHKLIQEVIKRKFGWNRAGLWIFVI